MKQEYLVYFESFGKCMKTVVLADNEEDAKNIIKEKIVFHEIRIRYNVKPLTEEKK